MLTRYVDEFSQRSDAEEPWTLTVRLSATITSLLTVIVLGACSPPRTPTEELRRPPVPVERAAISYLPIAPGLELPVVHGSVAGKPTLMVVDTGTAGNVMAGWLVQSLALPTTASPKMTHDPSGRPVAFRWLEAPHLVVEGFAPLADGRAAVVDCHRHSSGWALAPFYPRRR